MVAGQLDPESRARVADHAAGCATCHALVGALVTQHGHVQHDGAPVLKVGAVVGGRLRIDDILGIGGMGVVVAATHLELGHQVAVKFLRDEMVEDAAIVERFVREARAVVRLHTEHVCRVLDVARLPSGAPYIVMERLYGLDLARAIVRGPLAAGVAVDYVRQACTALAEAHGHGIVHRDLKPANLFLTQRRDGSALVKVLDFGIAKALHDRDSGLTGTQMLIGSPGYMSPEQLDTPREVDARSDIWAVGVTLYQLLSGHLPFRAASQTELAIQVMTEPFVPLTAPRPLARVIARCLEKRPERRYPDVGALAAELSAAALEIATNPAAVVITAPAPSVAAPPRRSRSGRKRKRSRAWHVVVPAVAVAGAAIALIATMSHAPATAAPRDAAPAVVATAPLPPVDAKAVADAAVAIVVARDAGAGRAHAHAVAVVAPRTAHVEPPPPRVDPPAPPDAAVVPVDAARSASMFFDAGVLPTRLPDDAILAGLQQISDKLQGCFRSYGVREDVTARFAVSPEGKVATVDLAREYAHSQLEGCLRGVVAALKLPRSRTGGELTTELAHP